MTILLLFIGIVAFLAIIAVLVGMAVNAAVNLEDGF